MGILQFGDAMQNFTYFLIPSNLLSIDGPENGVGSAGNRQLILLLTSHRLFGHIQEAR